MPMMMWNETTFPIERLCFDLKLEVLKQLDAKDVIELVRVNRGFQSMISSRPWIAFGHHVHEIAFGFDAHGFEAINFIRSSESRGVSLDVIRHSPFIKNIRSCNELRMREGYNSPINKDHAAFLKQLEAVNSLDLYYCAPLHLELLSHLSIKIKKYAHLPSFLQKAPSIKELVGHFIEAQLNECEKVHFDCSDDLESQFYYNALIKTHIKCVGISVCNENLIVPAIQRILSHGIPSKNQNPAVVRIYHDLVQRGMKATIFVFLKGYPGMKQIYGKNRQPFIALANDRLMESRGVAFPMKSLCFRRNINATRDCIYMLFLDEFLAFYIKPDEMIDH